MRTLLIDNYDSYTYNLVHLLARVNGTAPDVRANDDRTPIDLDGYDNIVISPGPGHPGRLRDFGVCADVLARATVPVLGVCLGHQGIAQLLGGQVVPAPAAKHGHISRIRHDGDPLFAGIPAEFDAVRYHSLCVAEPLPVGLAAIARSEDGVVMALRHRELPRWGVQFHPESIATPHGLDLIRNFHDLTRAERATGATVAPNVPKRHYRVHVATLAGAVDTEAAFSRMYAESANAFWLDSARVEPGLSRFSFLGDASGPLAEVVAYDADEGLVRIGGVAAAREPVLDYLGRQLADRVVDTPPSLPFDFVGGYVGYLGYELKADCGSPNRHQAPTPDAQWVFADRFVAVDHEEERTYLIALAIDDATASDALDWQAEVSAVLVLPSDAEVPPVHRPPAVADRLQRDRDGYVHDVLAAQDYLLAGESYEICLTNEAVVPSAEPAFTTYRRLRRHNPAPYAAFLRMGGVEVACSSPERFLRIGRDRVVEAKPIKGTAQRGETPEQDISLRRELASDLKSRAENLMIVDLMRNDLGRVCEMGSVHVPVLMAVESYQTVHQLVSTIRGVLRADQDAVDCVRACFPGGSMTGAPKPRTLEIIAELEDRARGIYSGTIGFLGLGGVADLNIVIRTMVLFDGRWHVGAGGAIVLDSDPHEEYAEMVLKASAPMSALPDPVTTDLTERPRE